MKETIAKYGSCIIAGGLIGLFRLPDFLLIPIFGLIYKLVIASGAEGDQVKMLGDVVGVYKMGPKYWVGFKSMVAEARFEQLRSIARGGLAGINDV